MGIREPTYKQLVDFIWKHKKKEFICSRCKSNWISTGSNIFGSWNCNDCGNGGKNTYWFVSEMTELKTLKDVPQAHLGKGETLINIGDLRQEAIKWIKSLSDFEDNAKNMWQICEETTVKKPLYRIPIIRAFKYFFNITESDLYQEAEKSEKEKLEEEEKDQKRFEKVS